MANLYDKAGLVNIPVGYQDGFLYNIKPEDNTLGFRFNRDSAATRVNKEGLIEQVGYFGPELVQNGNFSEIGPELVVNGDFATNSDWNLSNATISNGQLKINSVTGEYSGANQSILTIGKQYKLNIKVEVLSGGLNLYSGSGSPLIAYISQSGEYTYYFTAEALDGLLILVRNTSGDNILVDNVSVKEIGQNWETEGSSSLGLADFQGRSNVANINILNTSTASRIRQPFDYVNGKRYKVSVDVYLVSGNFRIDCADAFVSGNFVSTYTTGSWITLETEIQAISTGSNYIWLRSSNTVSQFYVSNVSVTEVLGDKPRIDYTDSLTSPSFLLEPQSTNLLTFSENLKNYENSNTICTSNYAISPDGTKNATRVDFTASSTNALGVNGSINNGETLTQSVFVKYIDAQFVQLWFGSSGFNGGNTNFDLINGTTSNPSGSSSTMKNMGNGWWRISSTRTATSTSGNTGVFKLVVVDSLASSRFGDEANGSVLVFGGQYEQKSYPTSYIPTAGSTVTRAQETCNDAGNASTFNGTEGVLYTEIAALADDLTFRGLSISDGTTNNACRIYYRNSSNRLQFIFTVGGVNQFSAVFDANNIKDYNKIAVSYKQNDFKAYLNGVKVAEDFSGTVLSAGILNKLSFNRGDGTENFYGKTKGVYVFNKALTDDELQQLTGPEYNSFAALAAAYNYTVI